MTPTYATGRGCALVTGASRGIGAAIALGLATDGWRVGVGFHSGQQPAEALVGQVRAAGGTACAIPADVRDAGAADELCSRAERELGGPLVVLVNNAAVSTRGLSAQIDDESWRTVIETNLSAAFRLTRRALRPMLRTGFGRIVNIASVAAEHPPAGQSAYAASKAGLVAFTKATAAEVARRAITVNAVSPGLIDTDLAASVVGDMGASVPAGRLGAPAEVAACVRFLLSDEAAYVTGSVVTVDGGLSTKVR